MYVRVSTMAVALTSPKRVGLYNTYLFTHCAHDYYTDVMRDECSIVQRQAVCGTY